MRIWTKAILISSVPFLCFFAFGLTEFGQGILRGNIPAGTDHWTADDIYMGAGLAPWVYGLIPFIALCAGGLISYFFDWRRSSDTPMTEVGTESSKPRWLQTRL
jgi:hypothetical protein